MEFLLTFRGLQIHLNYSVRLAGRNINLYYYRRVLSCTVCYTLHTQLCRHSIQVLINFPDVNITDNRYLRFYIILNNR